MSYAASSGKAFGWEVEKVTAALGILVDNGIDASKAGTGLRKIFIELAKSGMTYDEAMAEIRNSTNKLNTAAGLFGKTAANQAVILAENTTKLDDFTESLSDANHEINNMVDIMGDNLNTDLKLLGSAFDGLIQKGSVLNNVFRGVIQAFTDLASGTIFAEQAVDKIIEAGRKKTEAQKELQRIENTANAGIKSGNPEAYIRQLEREGNRLEEIAAIRAKLLEIAKAENEERDKTIALIEKQSKVHNYGSPEE